MAIPPSSIVEKTNLELQSLRGDNDSALIDQLVIEILLCGRIWSRNHKTQLDSPTLSQKKGRLHTNLRACLAYHELEKLDAYRWKDLGSLSRNERISDTVFQSDRWRKVNQSEISKLEKQLRDCLDQLEELTAPMDHQDQLAFERFHEQRGSLKVQSTALQGKLERYKAEARDHTHENFLKHLKEVTEDEKDTLERLGILEHPSGVWVVNEIVLEDDPDEPIWDQLSRDLYHVSYDSVQKVILSNLAPECPECESTSMIENKTGDCLICENCDYTTDDDDAGLDASGYFSLTISEIFQETLESFITEPTSDDYKYLEDKDESFGVLYMVDQHSLITAPEPFEMKDFLKELKRRLKERASLRSMNISNLKLRCTNATEKIEEGSQEWDTAIEIDKYELVLEPGALEENIEKLSNLENRVIKGWGGTREETRQPRVIYIDAVHLSNQIWGTIGERRSIDAFLRSIRITPYMDIVVGKAIESVDNSFKLLHGGDDFLLSYDEHSKGKEDLVTILRNTDLEALLGVGRWHKVALECPECESTSLIEDTTRDCLFCESCGYTTDDDQRDNLMRVIGKGFALPFWWWSETEAPAPDRISEKKFQKALKRAKKDRRQEWLLRATRNEVQIHPIIE